MKIGESVDKDLDGKDK